MERFLVGMVDRACNMTTKDLEHSGATVMKAVILAGGQGTRISEESGTRPKPMIEVGGRPLLWHIMKTYSASNINDFIICCGYKGYVIKEYFANYFLHMSDVTFDITRNAMEVHYQYAEPWKVTLVDTGEDSQTGGRLKRISNYLKDEEAFCLTYGDSVADIDIEAQIDFHRKHGKWATITAVRPPARFGALVVDRDRVAVFVEKPPGDGSLINGGFFVLSPHCLSLIEDDHTLWEEAPLKDLAARGQLMAWLHTGFWHPMDTLRDKMHLEELWQSGEAPWKRI